MSDADGIAIPPDQVEGLGAPPPDAVAVVAVRNPFTFARTIDALPEGLSIAEIIARIGVPAECRPLVDLDGWPVPEAMFPRVRPRKGHHVTVRMVPMGGMGGGNSGQTKNIASIVLGVVLIVVGIVLSAYGGAFLIPLGAGLLISGAAGLIFPPTVPKLGSLAGLGGGMTQAEAYALWARREAA